MGLSVAVCEGRRTAFIRDYAAYPLQAVLRLLRIMVSVCGFRGVAEEREKNHHYEKCPLPLRRQEKSGLCSHFSGCPLGWLIVWSAAEQLLISPAVKADKILCTERAVIDAACGIFGGTFSTP